jgi:hypothetical protein
MPVVLKVLEQLLVCGLPRGIAIGGRAAAEREKRERQCLYFCPSKASKFKSRPRGIAVAGRAAAAAGRAAAAAGRAAAEECQVSPAAAADVAAARPAAATPESSALVLCCSHLCCSKVPKPLQLQLTSRISLLQQLYYSRFTYSCCTTAE